MAIYARSLGPSLGEICNTEAEQQGGEGKCMELKARNSPNGRGPELGRGLHSPPSQLPKSSQVAAVALKFRLCWQKSLFGILRMLPVLNAGLSHACYVGQPDSVLLLGQPRGKDPGREALQPRCGN